MKTKLYFFLWVCLSTLLIACVDDDIEPDVVPVTGVSLNKTALALDEGESESLIATVIPDNATNKKVTWKSSDTSVATVNASGKVTAQATGTVVVVVITEDGAEVATCTVTCGDGAVEPEIPVTDVALTKSTLSLIEGQSESLQVIITPDDATNKKVAWVSNDESVAMVDVNGKVTALKAGSTTIVAVTEDGAMTASCKVTVEPAALLKGTRTILAYIAADNTLASFASLDLAEMKAGMAKVQDSNVHFLVYIDDGKSPRLLELKNEKGAVVETVVETYGSRNSVGVSETQEVFAKVFSNSKYQADSYGLVYWSHGDGWLPYPLRAGTRWVGQDKGNGDNRMNISEFVEILKSAPHFDFILFDACFNGSFHLDDNIVGSYIFNKGKTIATMGCTVNTIQDKWPDEFLGLLAAGMRIGQFTRFTCFLENHLIGDPTFHFTNNAGLDMDINQALVVQEGNVTFWKKQLNSPMADMQAMALRQLSMANYSGLVELLKKSYYESNYFVVRLEALRLLALNYPTEVADVLQTAMNDSYELIRRYAVEYVEKNCNPELLPAWIESYLLRGHENRHRFRIFSAINTFDHDMALNELKKQAADWSFYDSSYVNELLEYFPRQKKGLERDFALIGNPESTTKQIQSEISRFRNKPIAKAIEPLLNIIKNESQEEELRIAAAETLGWYNLYHDKTSIIKELETFQTSKKKVMNEIVKTINRLKGKNR